MGRKSWYVIMGCVSLLLDQGLGSNALHSSHPFGSGQRILNGVKADPVEFEFMVRLHPGGTELCAGSIIHENWILTAGHCVMDNKCVEMQIFPSTWRPHDLPTIKVLSCYKHENYVGSGFFCDIGLIETQENLVRQRHLRVIPLPPPGLVHDVGTLAVIAGWGLAQDGHYPNYLKKGDQAIYDWDRCNWDYQHATECTNNAPCPVRQIPSRSRCTIGFGDQPDGSAEGDFGGPVIVDGYLVGVMVGSISNNGSLVFGAPTLYMDTARFLRWIHSFLFVARGMTRQAPRDMRNC